MVYSGTFVAGDKFYWELSSAACDATKATTAAVAGSGTTQSFVFTAEGAHKLCLKSKDKTDAASQVGVSITLSLATPSNIIQSLSPAKTAYGTDVEVALTGAVAVPHNLKVVVVRKDVGCKTVGKAMAGATTLAQGATKFTISKNSIGDASGDGVHVVCAQLAGSIDAVEQQANATHATRFVVTDQTVKNNLVDGTITLTGVDCTDMAVPAMQKGFRVATAQGVGLKEVTYQNVMTKLCKALAVVSADGRMRGRALAGKSAVQDFAIEIPASLSAGKTQSEKNSLLQDIAYGITQSSMGTFKTAMIEAVKTELGANSALVTRMESDLSAEVSAFEIAGAGGVKVPAKVVESPAARTAVHAVGAGAVAALVLLLA